MKLDLSASTAEINAPKPPEPSKLALDKYLLELKKNLYEANREQIEMRINNIVTSCRRFRGASPSDLFGFFSGKAWATHKAHNDLHSTNQFQSLIRGAAVSYLSARIQLDVTAANQDPSSRSIEKIAKGIYRLLDQRDWNEITEKQMFYGGVLQLNYIIESGFNKDKDVCKIKIPQFGQIETVRAGRYVCTNGNCNRDGLFNEVQAEYSCPDCHSPVELLESPAAERMEVHTGFEELPAGETEMEVSGGWYWEVDPSNTNCSNIKKAKWVTRRSLAGFDELRRKYPHLKLQGRPEFSYAMRWILAFERGKDNPDPLAGREDLERREVEKRWFDKDLVESYVAPSDFELGNFRIKAGQKLTEVCPDGVVAAFVGDEIAFIDNENKNERLTAGCWQDDPTAFDGLGVLSAIPIQKKINRLENILWEGLTRSMFGSVVYNPEAFEGGKLEGSNRNIPLKKGFSQANAIDFYFRELKINGFSPEVAEYLQLQFELMQKIMGVPDAALGEADSANRTYGGQQLLANRAAGLLIPAKKSQAKAKEDWLLHQLKLIQKYYAPERILTMGIRFGQIWTEEDVEAFCTANLDNDILIEYKEGSEVPQTRAQQEQKLGALYAMGIFQEGNPNKPEVLKQLVDLSGLDVDIDFNGYDSNNRLAERRYEILRTTIARLPDADSLFQALQAQAGTNPDTGQPNPNPLTGRILSHPSMQVVPEAENHRQMIDFWARNIRHEAGGANPSIVLIETMKALIYAHQQALTLTGMSTNAMAGATQLPSAVGGALLNKAIDQGSQSENQRTKDKGQMTNDK